MPGEAAQVAIKIPRAMLEIIDEDGVRHNEHGQITFYAGGQQPDARSEELTEKKVLTREYRLL